MNVFIRVIPLIAAAFSLVISNPSNADEELKFGFIPYISSASLIEFQSPLKQFIANELKQPVTIVSAQDFDSFLARTRSGEYDILFTAPHFGRIAQKRDGYIPLAMTSHHVQGYFLTKTDSPINKLEDLKGKNLMAAQRISILFQLAVQKLEQKGLKEGKNITILETKTHNNALYAPLRDEADASVTGILLWHTLGQEYKEKLRIVDTTVEVPGFFMLVHPRMPKKLRESLRAALMKFPSTPEGKAYFDKTGFIGIEPLTEKVLKSMDPYTKVLQ